MGAQKFHLVGQDSPALQINVFGVGRGERHRQQFHAGLLGGAAGLVVVAAHARGYHVVPVVGAALAERGNVVPGQTPVGKLAAAIQADAGVALEQRQVVQRRHIAVAHFHYRLIVAMGGDDGIDVHATAASAHPVETAAHAHRIGAAGVSHLPEALQRDGALEVHPLQRHARSVGAQDGLGRGKHGGFGGVGFGELYHRFMKT